jgi:hypothetical protein
MHYEPACNRQEPVVYRIRNLFNGKKYIGSTRNCRSRMQYHINRLRAGKHHCSILQRAFNKHGEKAFVFEIIESCDVELLIIREQFHLDHSQPEYNINKVAGPAFRKGMKLTPEHRKKIGDAHRGKPKAYSRRISLVGRTFGRLTVFAYAGTDKRGEALWDCRCVCGNEKPVKGSVLRGGRSNSCGCLKFDARSWIRRK